MRFDQTKRKKVIDLRPNNFKTHDRGFFIFHYFYFYLFIISVVDSNPNEVFDMIEGGV